MSKKISRPDRPSKAPAMPISTERDEVPVVSSPATAVGTPVSTNSGALPFSRRNYTIMLAGIGLILLGFIIMSLDKEEFGFGFLGLTLGPVVAFVGFMVQFYAILRKK